MTTPGPASESPFPNLKFSHVQIYADSVEDASVYVALERTVADAWSKRNDADKECGLRSKVEKTTATTPKNRAVSGEVAAGDAEEAVVVVTPPPSVVVVPSSFATHGRDAVRQLVAGLGFRVTGLHEGCGTRSVVVTSSDPDGGVRFVVTSIIDGGKGGDGNSEVGGKYYRHLDAANLRRFYGAHSNRQGIAVLAFEIGPGGGSLDDIYDRYRDRHPALLADGYEDGPIAYSNDDGGCGARVLEVCAYYTPPSPSPSRMTTPGEDEEKEGRFDVPVDVATLFPPPPAKADVGTVLRFVEPGVVGGGGTALLPGIVSVVVEEEHKEEDVYGEEGKASSSQSSRCGCDTLPAAYFDHWVSNVVSRTEFLETLEDTLGFSPKVDFNAGVVAAGEAQIESTVTGNNAPSSSSSSPSSLPLPSSSGPSSPFSRDDALRDRSQIYLPVNNAITEVGHVHGFLEEIGQGVQHVASRVFDIVSFVQDANDRREMFGEGFTFLNIPRSYYGVLTKKMLIHCRNDDDVARDDREDRPPALLSEGCAAAVYDACLVGGVVSGADGAVDLDLDGDSIRSILDDRLLGSGGGGAAGSGSELGLVPSVGEEYLQRRLDVVDVVLFSRYVNLHRLLGEHLSEETYVAIVRNKILVDVQGEDLLFQIFTSKILHRKSGEEAPFFEFIQRVCSECLGPDGCPKKMKPGCGGFGIRNFLTLFLSIEVTKAMREASEAEETGNVDLLDHSRRKVDLFTDQLNESNPILTTISDAMTGEGRAREGLDAALARRARVVVAGHGENGDGDDDCEGEIERWESMLEEERVAKERANERLMVSNAKYQRLMKELRQNQCC